MLSTNQRFMRVLASVLVVVATLAVAAPAGASSSCDGISIDLNGTRLLNDGISDTGATVSVDVPAGTYDIVLWSSDYSHDELVDPTQDFEQWYLQLDGQNVALSTDIPMEETRATNMVSAVVLSSPASSARAVHLGQGNINSVDPVSACLIPHDVAEPEAPIEPEVPVQPEVVPETPVEPATVPEPEVKAPNPVAPATPKVPGPTADSSTRTIADPPVVLVQTPAQQAPQLALTGVTHVIAVGLAALFLAVGVVLTSTARRLKTSY